MNLKNNFKRIEGFILLKNGRVYDPYMNCNKELDILIENDRIVEVEKQISIKKKNSPLLTVKAEISDPPPPYSQPDCKISAFFDALPMLISKK